MLGHEVPSPEAARKFLYQFHDEGKLEEAQKELPVGQVRALAQVNRDGPGILFRGDSACWEKELLKWLRDDQRAGGPRGPITFGISVRMTPNLKKHIARLPGSMWKPYREDSEAVRECADVLNYWPEEEDRPEDAGPLRHIAIRMADVGAVTAPVHDTVGCHRSG